MDRVTAPGGKAAEHPLWAGVKWALRVWVAGGAVLACAYVAAPVSEAASVFVRPGRHSGRGVRVWDGRTAPSTQPFPAPKQRKRVVLSAARDINGASAVRNIARPRR